MNSHTSCGTNESEPPKSAANSGDSWVTTARVGHTFCAACGGPGYRCDGGTLYLHKVDCHALSANSGPEHLPLWS
jgi:hypothetical protein